jgi:hypothetical protein
LYLKTHGNNTWWLWLFERLAYSKFYKP